MSKTGLIYALLLLFCLNCTDIAAQQIIRGPYLQFSTTEGIIVRWRTDSLTNSKIWYGEQLGNMTDSIIEATLTTEHQIQISGLPANQKFYYSVGTTTQLLSGQSAEHYFKTNPAVGSTDPVNIWVLGDAGSKDLYQRKVRDAYYGFNGDKHIDMMLLLGDNAYEDGTDEEFQEAWFENMYEDRLINSTMWSCYGNHEAGSADSDDQTGVYFDIYNFPTNGEIGGVPSGTESYYSLDYANIHVISLNTHDEDRSPSGPMLQWLQADLDANTQEWTIVILHHPPYSGYDNNNSDTNSRETDVRENIVPMLEAAGVDLVLVGHSHTYQRSLPINGHHDISATFDVDSMALNIGNGNKTEDGAYVKSNGGSDDGKGTIYMVAGAAGKLSEEVILRYPAMYHNNSNKRGSVAIEVDSAEMTVLYIDEDGAIDDHFSLVKQSIPPLISISNPINETFYGELQMVEIIADASDENGTISKVDFFIDNNFIGEDFTFPYTTNWTPSAEGSYKIKTTATDNDGNFRSAVSNIQVGPVTTCQQTYSSFHDSEEDHLGNVSLGSSDLELVYDDTSQIVGVRFVDLRIPRNAVINSAKIQFATKDNNNINPCVINIRGELVHDSESLANDDFDLSNRPKTDTSVVWTPPLWETIGERGPDQLTVDLAPIIQEIVYQPAYSDRSAIVFLFEGIGRRNAFSYNGDPTNGPSICIEYNPYCLDSDGDEICDTVDPCPYDNNPSVICADNDADGYNSTFDCNDNNANINPGLPEIPNNTIDENCDGIVLIIDVDQDGFNSDQDCDDNNANINPGITEIPNNAIDEDCDGIALVIDIDQDGFNSDQDCDDNNPNINPGITEIPNNAIDEDCDGIALVIDIDQDGFNSDQDCDDNNPNINPGITEIPNNAIDEDCDGIALVIDIDQDGFNSDQDCDDNNPNINPGITEIPNNAIDEDCDGIALVIDIDQDGFNSDQDCDDNNANINPGITEIPNNAIDEDCDGIALVIDIDQDGFNSDQDCDDNNANINPGITEIPNNAIDEDCDGIALVIDIDQDGFNSDQDCDDNNANINPGITEIPNNAIDEDCDGIALVIDIDQDGFNSDQDCDDNNANINPGITEIPNNAIDEDCDGIALVIDIDQDGFNSDQDCDDNNPNINPGITEIPNNAIDEDCDGIALVIDIDQDGFNSDQDCDDNNADINPGITEIPNNTIDEDCDGIALIIDVDEDGFNSDEDCDDNNADINPDANEIPNNDVDENCDDIALVIDTDEDGFNSDEDCDDNNADINPDANEIPNNDVDENCDDIALVIDTDEDGFNSDEDCDDNNADINPDANEIPNNEIDEDCDGVDLISSSNNIKDIDISIYPNPTTGRIHIHSNGLQSATLQIINITNNYLIKKSFSQQTTLDLSGLPVGCYFLQIQSEGKVWQSKVILQK